LEVDSGSGRQTNVKTKKKTKKDEKAIIDLRDRRRSILYMKKSLIRYVPRQGSSVDAFRKNLYS